MVTKYILLGYLVIGKRGPDLTKQFYELSRKQKIKLIEEMAADDILDSHLEYKIANALLQHDNTSPMGKEYPCFIEPLPNSTSFYSGIRKLNSKAKAADKLES